MEQDKQLTVARVPDRGPWKLAENGEFLYSDDFEHDVHLRINGDFGGPERQLKYAAYLARILDRGCALEFALAELPDDTELLKEMLGEEMSPQGAMLRRAAEEIAMLRGALAEADKALEVLNASKYLRKRLASVGELSAFGQSLQAALASANTK